MKRNYIGISLLLAVASVASSCIEEMPVVEDIPSVASREVVFGAQVADDVIITRSGQAGPSSEVLQKSLKSESSDVTMPVMVETEQGIRSAWSEGPATRAAITTDKESINELVAWAIYTDYKDATLTDINQRYLYFDDMEVDENGAPFTKNNADGIFYPSEGHGPYLWISESNSDFNFVAVTPANSGFKARINTANNAVSFDYTVPADASEHKDILVASPDPVPTDYGQSVPLTFKHVMAQVNVKVGEVVAGTITSIKLKGVYNKGSYFPDGDGWTNTTIENGGEFIVPLPEGGLNVDGNSNGNAITTVETSFMMIPQQLFTGAEIEVGFTDGTNHKELTLRASLQGDIWAMNTTTNYLINIDGNYNISIIPLDKVLDSHYIITKVEVSSDYSMWTLRASANDGALVTVQHESEVNSLAKQGFWTDKYASKDANGNYYVSADAQYARGAETCRGSQGAGQIVYVFIPENVTGETRTITLSVDGSGPGGSGTKTLLLTQEPVIWMDPTGNKNESEYWGCELLLEGGQVPWGFCWDGLNATFILKQGGASYNPDTDEYGQGNIPKGQDTKIKPAMELAGIDVDRMLNDPNYYIRVAKGGDKSDFYIRVDLSKIGNLGVAETFDDGWQNTYDVYHFEGISALSQLIDFCNSWGDISNPDGRATQIQEGLDYAVMYAMKRNRFYIYEEYVQDVGQTMTVPVIFDKDINWYLPAKDQFPVFMNTNWGQQFTFNDLYWTSTSYAPAGSADTFTAHSYAYLNGIETISRRTETYLTFALRRYTISEDVEIPINPEDVIKPGDDISGGGTGGEGGGNQGGDVEGNT